MREFMRHRAFLVRLRARIRGRVHQILWKHGVISPWSDLFGIKAQQWLGKLSLRSPYKEEREELTAMWRDISERLSLHNRTCEEMGARNLQAGIFM